MVTRHPPLFEYDNSDVRHLPALHHSSHGLMVDVDNSICFVIFGVLSFVLLTMFLISVPLEGCNWPGGMVRHCTPISSRTGYDIIVEHSSV